MDGERFEGYWLEDEKHGKGIYYYKNGDIYQGDFLKDLREG